MAQRLVTTRFVVLRESQTRAVWSLLAVASRVPSGLKQTEVTAPVCPARFNNSPLHSLLT